MLRLANILACLFAAVLALAIAAPSFAAVDDTQGPEYVIGIDDVLAISVSNRPELGGSATVLTDGTISVPEVGLVKAAGKTSKQLAKEIEDGLSKLYNNLTVTVAVTSAKAYRVRVLGAVKSPGAVPYRPGMKLVDAVLLSGGITGKPGRMRGRLVRGTGNAQELNINAALEKPEGAANVDLQTDDLLVLDETDPAKSKIYVMGRVKSPGAFDEGEDGLFLLAALTLAGYPMDDAALTKCYVQRGGEKLPVNLFESVGKGRLDPAIQAMVLRAGDILVVPAIDNRIQVMGQVTKPGEFPIPETRDIRVLDAIGLAGGPTQVADLKKAGVFRVTDGKPTLIKVDLVKMQRSGDMTKNFVMQKDDMLFLPMRGPSSFRIESLTSPLSLLYYLGRL